MKTHILYRDKVITPEDKEFPAQHIDLGEIRNVHAAVLSTLAQAPREKSARNRALPHPEDALQEGRILAQIPLEGVSRIEQTIADLANRMQRSRRTLKDGASTHPIGRYHSSASLVGLVGPNAEFNAAFAKELEESCAAGRAVLMPRGLTVYPYATPEAALLVVRPFYACDDQYLNEGEMDLYHQFY